MLLTAFAFLIAAWLATATVLRHAADWGLVHQPNHRSSHTRITPHGGGLGIVIAACLLPLVYFLLDQENPLILWIPALALVIAVTGLLDDIHHLPARVRLLFQTGSIIALLVVLDNVGDGLQGLGGLPLLPTLALLLFAGLWWLNLFNFMDGIDGLAGIQAIFMLLGAAGLAATFHSEAQDSLTWRWLIYLAIATIGFLLHNWPPARIFMGDTGSLFLAFMIFALALITVSHGWLSYPTWGILGSVFVSDATITLLRRAWSGQRWAEAHRSHAYQCLSRRWRSHRDVTLLALGINLLWVLPLAWFSLYWPDHAWWLLVLTYLPLIAGTWRAGAGTIQHDK